MFVILFHFYFLLCEPLKNIVPTYRPLLNHSIVWFVVRSVETFERLMKDERTSVLLKRQQKTLGHSLPLSTYLFKPVQRILKYHLLLQVSVILN